jgi:hypothetical protein
MKRQIAGLACCPRKSIESKGAKCGSLESSNVFADPASIAINAPYGPTNPSEEVRDRNRGRPLNG